MSHVSFTYDKALKFFDQHEVDYLSPFVESAHHMLHEKLARVTIFLAGLIYPKTMIKKNMHV